MMNKSRQLLRRQQRRGKQFVYTRTSLHDRYITGAAQIVRQLHSTVYILQCNISTIASKLL